MLRTRHFAILACAALLAATPIVAAPPSPAYRLVWADEFDGTALDTGKWSYRQLGARRDGVNVEEAVRPDGKGHLVLTTSRAGNTFHTAMIGTQGKFETCFGYFECRIRFQREPGHWSAFWLQSPELGKGVDPARYGAEIDVIEYLAIHPETANLNIHWGGYGKEHKHAGRKVTRKGLARGFHAIGLEWTPEAYVFSIDGEAVWRTTEGVSHRPEYIILSLEVGKWAGDIRKARLPDSMRVDYVRVYKREAPVIVSTGPAAPAQPVPICGLPAESLRDVTDSGAWCRFQDPRAVCRDGKTYAGWIAGDGSTVVGAYDHRNGAWTRAILREKSKPDDHASPALLVRPDGRLVVFYAKGAGRAMYVRATERPGDIASWRPEHAFAPNTGRHGRNAYFCPNPVELASEGGAIYLFWHGDDGKPTMARSSDGGRTWTTGRIVLAREGPAGDDRPCLKVHSNGRDRIHLAFTGGHRGNEPTNGISYACYRGGAFYRADGHRIADLESLPLDPRHADVIYDGRTAKVRAWVGDVAAEASGRPVIVYTCLSRETDPRYRYARWSGRAWEDHEIVAVRKGSPETSEGGREPEPRDSGGVVLDPGDPSIVYLSRSIDGVFEIERWITPDGGATWRREAVTSHSKGSNVRPVAVRHHGPGGPTVLWMYLRGGHRDSTRFAPSIKMDRVPSPLPPVSELPSHPELPDPFVRMNGERVKTKEDWYAKRRPELERLFQHYMYGYFPPAPVRIEAAVERADARLLGGRATEKLVTIRFGPRGTPPIHLLLVVPNARKGPAPVFLGLNFCGNHALLDDPAIPLPRSWMYGFCPGCKDHRATDAGRGARKHTWPVERIIDRGYALATFFNGDIDPDRPDFSDGIHPPYLAKSRTEPGPHDWGTIAAWAWGLERAVDYLVTDPDIDARRIALVGHSRNGKTALLAAAFDERIALAIPHQAGCGGTAPSRGKIGESVARINTSFPHWFNDTFPAFNECVDRLPFDQHELIALVAPRPVLLTNAVQDTWANPAGQFRVLQAADPVYRFLGAGGLEADRMPEPGRLVGNVLGYFIRPGKHAMTEEDWEVFLQFADRHLRPKG